MSETKQSTSYTYHEYNASTYVNDIMQEDMRAFSEGSKTKTGYANLDAITSLYPGLYVLGAISSLGKTTFVQQMSDQLAKAGENVIFFSLEQSSLELVSKSLSRIMNENGYEHPMTSLQIRKNGNDERVIKAVEEYKTYASNITIVECSFRVTIDDIDNYVTDYIKSRNVKPIVIIDYLQVIQAVNNLASTKDAVDMHVRRLKQLQSDNKIVMIVISSLNRQNYLSTIDFESFKESGGIEYTADVVWGLQLSVLHDDLFNSQAKLNEKRERIREAKASNPRMIELVCLKNRFGISSYSCGFNYYPQFDRYEPIMDNIPDEVLEYVDADSFVEIKPWMNCPF